MSGRGARRAGWSVAWAAFLGAAGCQVLFGVELPDQGDVGAGSGGSAAGTGPTAGEGGRTSASGSGGSGTSGSGVGASGAGSSSGAAGDAGTGAGGSGGGTSFISHIATGVRHSCAIVEGGQVFCWGLNDYGQLGDGTQTDRSTPVPVLASPGGPPLAGAQALALGYSHSCALLGGNEARCWGRNFEGQLGDGTQTDRSTPVPVLASPGGPPLAGAEALALGYYHSCALLGGNEARCWGWNFYGQLGDGTQTDRSTPVPVLASPGELPLAGVEALALSAWHSCARMNWGETRCWGRNNHGQLGDGTQTDRSTPVPVLASPGGLPLAGVEALALSGAHSCVLLGAGVVHCAGYNAYGQLGDGTQTDRSTPVPVLASPGGPPLAGAKALALGDHHSCALLDGGQARCWGRNTYGQVGDGTPSAFRLTPVPVREWVGGPPLAGAQVLALGQLHSCARMNGGQARCWGWNLYGQVGDSTQTNRSTPVPVQFPPGSAGGGRPWPAGR